jgi:prophage regulatory protein
MRPCSLLLSSVTSEDVVRKKKVIIRADKVMARTGLPKSSLYAIPGFPGRISLSGRRCGWLEDEVEAWIEGRVRASRGESDKSAA